MSKQTLYATATGPYNNRTVRFPVPVGEVDSPDGTVFDTSMHEVVETNKRYAVKHNGLWWPKGSMTLLDQKPDPRTSLHKRRKRKLERQNRRKGRV